MGFSVGLVKCLQCGAGVGFCVLGMVEIGDSSVLGDDLVKVEIVLLLLSGTWSCNEHGPEMAVTGCFSEQGPEITVFGCSCGVWSLFSDSGYWNECAVVVVCSGHMCWQFQW